MSRHARSLNSLDKLIDAEKPEWKNPAKNPDTNKPEKSKPQPAKKERDSQTGRKDIEKAIVKIVRDSKDEEGWILISDIGTKLPKLYPDFDVRNFGHKKMLPFLESFGKFEFKKVRDPANKTNPNGFTVYFKLK